MLKRNRIENLRTAFVGSVQNLALIEEALSRLVAWSLAQGANIQTTPSSDKDHAVGVVLSGGSRLIWRVYPRQKDGAKITILPGNQKSLPRATREAIIAVLKVLDHGLEIGPNQELGIGIHRIASAKSWDHFVSALDAGYLLLNRSRANR